ncbi:MAG: hypothetical protein JO323_17960 [Acidobacteriia bacterium]|nr:hypothetical protein [Terriglobia bacterium]
MKLMLAAAAITTLIAAYLFAQDRQNYGKDKPYPERGKADSQAALSNPNDYVTLSGILVDAGCRDRSQQNIASSPIPANQQTAAETPEQQAAGNAARSKTGFAGSGNAPAASGTSVAGITVDAKTLQGERADVLEHQVQDLLSRQVDPSCAITGETHGFALLLDDGRLLDLDGGGNTFAAQVVAYSTAGSTMLNGKGSGVKPRVMVKGQIWGDHLNVNSMSI